MVTDARERGERPSVGKGTKVAQRRIILLICHFRADLAFIRLVFATETLRSTLREKIAAIPSISVLIRTLTLPFIQSMLVQGARSAPDFIASPTRVGTGFFLFYGF